KQFGLAGDGADLRDLEAGIQSLSARLEAVERERDDWANGAYYKDLEQVEARLQSADATIAKMREALEFYADPDTYVAIAFFADSPSGEFMDDFSEDHGGDYNRPMPGKAARQALSETANP